MIADSFTDSIARMRRAGLILSTAGAVAVLTFAGWRNALGFACGAVIAHFNFGLWQQIAGALSSQASPQASPSMALLAMRYLLIGAATFVIMKVLDVSALPVIGGLLVTAAAVLVEIVRQLVNPVGKP